MSNRSENTSYEQCHLENVEYGMIKEVYMTGKSIRTSFGIVAYVGSDNDGSVIIIQTIHDITSDKERLQGFVNSCNRIKLSLIHLPDAIDDFIAS